MSGPKAPSGRNRKWRSRALWAAGILMSAATTGTGVVLIWNAGGPQGTSEASLAAGILVCYGGGLAALALAVAWTSTLYVGTADGDPDQERSQ